MRPAAHTQKSTVARTNTADSATCQAGGPGCIEMRSIIRNGVAVGISDSTVATIPSGARRIDPAVIIGSIMISITGVIRFCESFRSVQAAPTATKMEPNSRTAITRKNANQASCDGDDGVPVTPVVRHTQSADHVNGRQQNTDRGAADQFAHHQLERRDRADQHLTDAAHLLFDDAVEQLWRARHDREKHENEEDEGNALGAGTIHLFRRRSATARISRNEAELIDADGGGEACHQSGVDTGALKT